MSIVIMFFINLLVIIFSISLYIILELSNIIFNSIIKIKSKKEIKYEHNKKS